MGLPEELFTKMQADLLFLPHDTVCRKTYKYALTVVDVASRFKAAEPLTTYSLQVDPWRDFIGSVSQLLAKYGVEARRGRVDIHRDQGIVERFNWTLAERLFGHQYAVEMRLPEGERSTAWVSRLPR